MTWHPTDKGAGKPPVYADDAGPWPVTQVFADGSTRDLGTLARFANAQSFAATLAESIVRDDRLKAWEGKETSRTIAVIVGWDVYDIPAMILGKPGIRSVSEDVPPEDAYQAAYALALKYRDTLRY